MRKPKCEWCKKRVFDSKKCGAHHLTPMVMLKRGFQYRGIVKICRTCHNKIHKCSHRLLCKMSKEEQMQFALEKDEARQYRLLWEKKKED